MITYLFFDLVFTVSSSFNDLPEVNELVILNAPVMVVVDRIKEFLRRDLAKILAPMLHGLVLLYRFGIILVEHFKDLIYQLQ